MAKGNSKHRKNHKQKLQARKNKMTQDKNRMDKMRKDFIMNLIKKEQDKGMFNDNPTIQPVGPVTDTQIIEGPSI
jgi:hypothetical protein